MSEAHCWALGKRCHVRCLALSILTFVQREENRDSMPSPSQWEVMCEPPVLICKNKPSLHLCAGKENGPNWERIKYKSRQTEFNFHHQLSSGQLPSSTHSSPQLSRWYSKKNRSNFKAGFWFCVCGFFCSNFFFPPK